MKHTLLTFVLLSACSSRAFSAGYEESGTTGCLVLDGAEGSRIEIPNIFDLQVPFTVEMRLRLEESDRFFVGERCSHETLSSAGWGFGVNNGGVSGTAFGIFEHLVNAPMTGTGWHHIAWTFDGEVSRLFLDGALLGEQAQSTLLGICPQTSVVIGALYDSWGNIIEHHAGAVDELRISSNIRYVTSFTPPERHEPDVSTLGLWHMDEGAGGVITDSSGYENSGELLGGVRWEKNCQ